MHLPKAELLDLISEIYDCALKPDHWPAVFERMAAQVDGVSAALSVHDPVANQARFSSTWNVPEGVIERYNQVYTPINPVMTSGWFCSVDEPISAAEYCGPEEYFGSRFGREFLQPLGWGDAVGTHLMKMANRYSVLAIFVSWDRGVIGREALDFVRLLSPHVRRAITISDLLDAKDFKEDILSDALDLLTVGIVLTDEEGKIAHSNRLADEFLASRTGVTRDGDYLVARDAKGAAELTSAIKLASKGRSALVSPAGIGVPLVDKDGRDLAAWVLPLDTGARQRWGAPLSASVAVFIKDLSDSQPFQGEVFVKRYNITPAECQVLMLLLQGMRVSDMSDTLNRQEATIKSHLSSLFAKTGTAGQADLVRLTMTAVAPAAVARG